MNVKEVIKTKKKKQLNKNLTHSRYFSDELVGEFVVRKVYFASLYDIIIV